MEGSQVGSLGGKHGRDLVSTTSSLSTAIFHRWGACLGKGGRPNSDRPPLATPLPLYIGLQTLQGVVPEIVVVQAV